jgi:hypothetical protein
MLAANLAFEMHDLDPEHGLVARIRNGSIALTIVTSPYRISRQVPTTRLIRVG